VVAQVAQEVEPLVTVATVATVAMLDVKRVALVMAEAEVELAL
jgi:hypothetical protein